MTELTSVEETLIKISLKTFYFICTALVAGTFFAVMLYASIIRGQEQILTEVKKNAAERIYQIQDLRKDLNSLDTRITKLER